MVVIFPCTWRYLCEIGRLQVNYYLRKLPFCFRDLVSASHVFLSHWFYNCTDAVCVCICVHVGRDVGDEAVCSPAFLKMNHILTSAVCQWADSMRGQNSQNIMPCWLNTERKQGGKQIHQLDQNLHSDRSSHHSNFLMVYDDDQLWGQNDWPLQSRNVYLLTSSRRLSHEHNLNGHTREPPNAHYLTLTSNVALDISWVILPAGSLEGYLAISPACSLFWI